MQFYNYLIEKQELQINTLETIRTLLHPTFQLAVRDDIIRKNPSDGVMVDLKKTSSPKSSPNGSSSFKKIHYVERLIRLKLRD